MLIKSGEKTLKLPDLFIIGAAKCGTTSFYYWLNQSPRFFFPNKLKEPLFFSQPGKHVKSLEEYARLYEKASKEQILVDASVIYFHHPATIDNIRHAYGKAFQELKFIVVLRDPLKRTLSEYFMGLREGWEKRSLEEIVKCFETGHPEPYISHSFFWKQLVRWLEKVSYQHIKIVIFEKLLDKRLVVLKDLELFLGVSLQELVKFEIPKLNIGGTFRNKICEKIYHLLYNRKLINLSKKVFPETLLYMFDSLARKMLLDTNHSEIFADENSLKALRKILTEDATILGKQLGILDELLKYWQFTFSQE
ncbi:sulfotransferase domain-containing protein [Thermosulfurimonas dismutans]|uniref:Sulfotransferase n=1 Tax=Thermosulfurimonas dismutans TaxID=999894 RepID=A0A179D506_9BACT|nr:sulfotransferase domain-containing protein [Thermosulfurimonas dismutans]OAQ21126.1 Sulfotransferase [Thermosulfurimonas dismutans]